MGVLHWPKDFPWLGLDPFSKSIAQILTTATSRPIDLSGLSCHIDFDPAGAVGVRGSKRSITWFQPNTTNATTSQQESRGAYPHKKAAHDQSPPLRRMPIAFHASGEKNCEAASGAAGTNAKALQTSCAVFVVPERP